MLPFALGVGACAQPSASAGWSQVGSPAPATQSNSAAPEVGQPAPDFALDTPAGETVRLSELQGKPVVLNFWATWCGPCRAEMPELQALQDDRGPKGLQVIAVDIQESPEAVQEFRQSLGINFPTPIDADGAVTRNYLVRGVPTTLIIDREGIIRHINVGPVTRRALEEKLAALQL